MQDWLQMPEIQRSDVIGKYEDGSDITQDVRVFSFAGLTLSDLRKSLVEGTVEVIMWDKWVTYLLMFITVD